MISIRDITVFLTAPDGQNLVVVRVDTSEPGLYGLGCATLAYRAFAVKEIVERYLKPLLIGRDASRIEDIWKLLMVNAYWRNGPVGNNAVSGIDMALWDIKGKLAGMPLYDLLGGKCRDRVDVYRHCNAGSADDVLALADEAVESGCKTLRVAYTGFDTPEANAAYLCLANHCKQYDPQSYRKNIVSLLSSLRKRFGDRIQLITDIHERIDPPDALKLMRALQPLDMYFVEDPVSPEQSLWLKRIRALCATPVALGEVFSHPGEWTPLVQERLIDFLRLHLSAIGGLTPARKAAVLAETYGVRTAWHGSLDMTPIALAVQAHLDFASQSFGIQEYYGYHPHTTEVFPGTPVYRDGALWLEDTPGHGVTFNEEAARAFPPHNNPTRWTEMRLPDGTLHTP